METLKKSFLLSNEKTPAEFPSEFFALFPMLVPQQKAETDDNEYCCQNPWPWAAPSVVSRGYDARFSLDCIALNQVLLVR